MSSSGDRLDSHARGFLVLVRIYDRLSAVRAMIIERGAGPVSQPALPPLSAARRLSAVHSDAAGWALSRRAVGVFVPHRVADIVPTRASPSSQLERTVASDGLKVNAMQGDFRGGATNSQAGPL